LREAIRTKQARITADPHTNSIIVIAPPDAQRVYEQLIRTLDKRRPQVLIECTIVTIDTSNDAQFGVEIGAAGGSADNQVITFSSFGLSEPDPRTGRLALIPGVGFNGALISSDIADVVVRALSRSSRARVTSSPRILVNDNNVGTLSSIAEFPYSSVNASDTIATTSFGDYVQAGTEITVTPHISESDYLQLEYSVSLSSFTGQAVEQGDTVLPPPRKSDSVQSQVTIPDGATIVVGGLNRRNFNRTVDAVPFLGRLPIVGALFSNRTRTEANTTLFVFIRPVILRDDKFADLKFVSEKDVREAGLPGDFPRSEPLTIR
jgi:general secretion pathway protein D